MTSYDIKSYLSYLSKLEDEYNNTDNRSIAKEIIDSNYSVVNEKIESSNKASKFIVGDRFRKTKCKNICGKDYSNK